MPTDWSDTPPTEAGWYWLKNERDTEIAAQKQIDGLWWVDGPDTWEEWSVADNYQFGSRIPSNAELLAMHKEIAKLTEERNAAEAELEAATQRLLDSEVA